jgi:SAM-dependent methyltransferase
VNGPPRSRDAYDALPYPGVACAFAHPDRLAVLARLHGLQPAPVASARVLEIGAGVGGNLVPIAASLPGADCVGIDRSHHAIAAATRLTEHLALANVTLFHADFQAFLAPDAPPLGTFDYVIAHGLLAWIPPAAQAQLFALIGRVLAPEGVAVVSYHALPGYHDMAPLQALMAFHTAPVADPALRIQQARDIVHWHVERQTRLFGPARGAIYTRLLAEIDALPDAVLLHDLLAPDVHPLYFEDALALAAGAGLRWLGNARPSEPRLGSLPTSLREMVRAVPSPERQQQYMDFLFHTRFRATAFCRAERAPVRAADPATFLALYAASRVAPRPFAALGEPWVLAGDEGDVSLSDGAAAVLSLLATTTPAAKLVAAWRAEAAHLDDMTFIGGLAELHFAGVIELASAPPAVADIVPEHPQTGPLQRAQAQAQRGSATSLWHREVGLDPNELALLARLDGTHTALALAGTAPEGALTTLQRAGFLVAPDATSPARAPAP